MSAREVTPSLLRRLRLSRRTARHGRGAWRCPQPTLTWWTICDRVPRAYVTCSGLSVLERGTEGRGWDDGKRPQEVFVKSLQGQHEVVHASGPSALLAQPTDELEAQLRCKAAEVLQPNFFQETPSVSPEHHVNIHVLGAVTVLAPPVGGTRKLQNQRLRTTSRGRHVAARSSEATADNEGRRPRSSSDRAKTSARAFLRGCHGGRPPPGARQALKRPF